MTTTLGTATRWSLALAAAGALAAPAAAAPALGGLAPGTAFAPVAAQVLTRPQAVLGTDGRRHLAYELVLTDAVPAPLKVTRVEVRDAARRRVLLRLAGPALARVLRRLGEPERPLRGALMGPAET